MKAQDYVVKHLARRDFLSITVSALAGLLVIARQAHGLAPNKELDNAKRKYHSSAPNGPLPALLDASQFSNRPVVERVYALAAMVGPVLYQLPCYCDCDRERGHQSLYDCFVGSHGAECGICQREVVFAVIQTKHGLSPSDIRAKLANGDWRNIKLDSVSDLPAA